MKDNARHVFSTSQPPRNAIERLNETLSLVGQSFETLGDLDRYNTEPRDLGEFELEIAAL